MSENIKPRFNVSHFSIFDYWKDKAITEDGEVCVDYGYDGCDTDLLSSKKSIGVVIDWGEPECWACGQSIPLYNYDNIENGLRYVYNTKEVKHFLQKCHIVAHSIGGDESVENMFLLCKKCHHDSPDTVYKREFLRWVYKTRQKGTPNYQIWKDVIDELQRRKVPPLFLTGDLKLDYKLSSHCGEIVPETKKAILVGAAQERWEKIKQIVQTEINDNVPIPMEQDEFIRKLFGPVFEFVKQENENENNRHC